MANGDLIASRVKEGQLNFPCGGCSDPPCCLYPSVTSYPTTDLLDSFFVNKQFASGTVLMTHVAGTRAFYGSYNIPVPVVTFIVRIMYDNAVNWRKVEWAQGQIEPPFNAGGIVWLCLMGKSLGSNVFIEDLFPDTLTVNGSDSIDRTDPCTWTGPKSSGGTWRLRYDSSIYKFKLNRIEKTDPQSSPVGTYGSNTVSA